MVLFVLSCLGSSLRFRVSGLGFKFRVEGLGLRVGFRVEGLGSFVVRFDEAGTSYQQCCDSCGCHRFMHHRFYTLASFALVRRIVSGLSLAWILKMAS